MRLPILFAAALAAAPTFSLAQEPPVSAEAAAFNAQVRAYLLSHPEVILEALDILEQRRAAEAAQADGLLVAQNADALFRDGFSQVFGNPDGDVTIVEFADYRCGYCKQAHPMVKQLLADDGGIRLIYKEFPILGKDSMLASQVAMAAQALDPAAYVRLNDALMTAKGALDEAALFRLAAGAGFEEAALRKAMEAPEIAERIRGTYKLAEALKVEGTPTFVIGDQIVRGFVQLDQMRELVTQARAAKG